MILEYDIHYWDSTENKFTNDHGVIGGGKEDTYGSLVDKIAAFYERENIVTLQISELETILNVKELRRIVEEN